jgi:hypothetical protein
MDIGGWLRSLGLEQYEAAFHANAVDAVVLRDLTHQDLEKLGVRLGHRRKLLRAISALDGALMPASAPRPTPLPIPPEAILAAAAAGASRERQQGEDHSVSPSPQPSPMSSRFRPAEMIGDQFLPSPEGPTLLLTASDDRHDDDIQTAKTGEAYGAHDYYDDLPSPRWRDRLVMVIAVIALAGLGAVGAFAYRAVLAGAVLPALPPFIKAENAPNENVPNYGDDRPSDLSQTSIASAGSSEEFVSRWSADIQEPPKTVPISPNQSASPPSALGSGAVAPIAPALAAPPPANAPPALTATSLAPTVPAPVSAPPSSTPKKIQAVVSRSDGLGQTDTSAATAKSPAAKPSAAAAPPAGNQPLRLAPDADGNSAARAPEAKQTAAAVLPVGRPLSLAPDAHGHSAASPPSRSRMPAGTGTAAEASSGGGYAVAVASERSAADADAVFRSLQAKFPNQLGGREPIVRRTDLGPEGIYYRASIGPFVSMKAAARVCSSLKAAGESCLVEKN